MYTRHMYCEQIQDIRDRMMISLPSFTTPPSVNRIFPAFTSR